LCGTEILLQTTTSIDVCVCAYRRESVVDAIASISAQNLPDHVVLRVLVADNDSMPSAAKWVAQASDASAWPVVYIHAPAHNISVARNACLDHADADWVAFLDDDEVARPDWLAKALETARNTRSDIVFGPALARYPVGTPDWIRQNDFHTNRVAIREGTVETGHTSNVLMRFAGTRARRTRFDVALGQSGGEDTDLFFRLHRAGMKLTVCDDAVVEEEVAPARLRLQWLIDRRFAEGTHYGASAPGNRAMRVGKSIAKAGYCALRTLGSAMNKGRAAYWFLRAVFHCGVARGSVGRTQRTAYGVD